MMWLVAAMLMAMAFGAMLFVGQRQGGVLTAAVILTSMAALPVLVAMAGLGWHRHILPGEPLRLQRNGMGRYFRQGFLVVWVPFLLIIPATILLFLTSSVLPDEPGRTKDAAMSVILFGFSVLSGALMAYVSPIMPEVALNSAAQDATRCASTGGASAPH